MTSDSSATLNTTAPDDPFLEGTGRVSIGFLALASALLITWLVLPAATLTLGVGSLSVVDGVIVVLAGSMAALATPLPRFVRWLLIFLMWMAAVTLVFTSNGGMVEYLLQAVVLATPFLALFLALSCSARERHRLGTILIVIWWVEAIIMSAQAAIPGDPDRVFGTLLGSAKGAHIAPFLLVAVLPVIWKRYGRATSVALTTWALALAVLGDAKQIAIWAAGTLVLFAAVTRPRMTRRIAAPTLIGAVAVSGAVSAIVITGAFGGIAAKGYITDTLAGSNGKIAVIVGLLGSEGPYRSEESVMIGAGAGQTVSYTALVASSSNARADSIAGLELNSAYHGYFYSVATLDGAAGGGSSFVAPDSTLLGILGDSGVVGLTLFLLAFGSLIAAVFRSGAGALISSAWIALLFVAAISNWLEFTEVGVVMACVTVAVARRGPRTPVTEGCRDGVGTRATVA